MKDSNLTINITAGTIIKAILLVLLCYLLYILRGLVLILLVAITIASAVEPGTKWLVRRKFPRPLAAISIFVIIAFVLLSIFYFILPPLLGETAGLLNNLPQYVQTIDIINP